MAFGFGNYNISAFDRGRGASGPTHDTGWDDKGRGRGMAGLPSGVADWGSAARYGFGPAMEYSKALAPAQQFFRQGMNKDWSGELMGLQRESIERGLGQQKSQYAQAQARSGSGGGQAVSPMAQYQLQMETQARAGEMGRAAQAAVMQAQSMRAQMAQGYQNTLANQYQAWMAPAYMQRAGSANVPLGQQGPSMVGPAMQAGAAALNYLA